MAITTHDGLVAAVAAAQLRGFFKPTATTVAGFTYTHWRNAGTPGAGAGSPTASGRTLDRTSAGSLDCPAASGTSYLASFSGKCTAIGALTLADRLVETGALSMIVTTAQTVNSVALPARATGATDVELWLEVHSAGGTTASATVTASYTNQSGQSGRTATLTGGIPASGTPANRTYRMSLQAGDTGVQSVQSVTLGTSTGTAGVLGVTLRRSLVMGVVASANLGFVLGWPDTGLAIVADDPALELLWQATGTASGALEGYVEIAQG